MSRLSNNKNKSKKRSRKGHAQQSKQYIKEISKEKPQKRHDLRGKKYVTSFCKALLTIFVGAIIGYSIGYFDPFSWLKECFDTKPWIMNKDTKTKLPVSPAPSSSLDTDSEEGLLDYRSRSIPMIGRDRELEQLEAFLQSDKKIAVYALTGPSGSDKERLALEFCLNAQEQGWKTGYLNNYNLENIGASSFSCNDLTWNYPSLLIVENSMPFAEVLKKLIKGLSAAEKTASERLRILLLADEADSEGGWFRGLFNNESINLFPTPPIIKLPLLDIEAQIEMLSAILEKTGNSNTIQQGELEFMLKKRLLAAEWSGEPLFLTIAALRMKNTKLPEVLSLNRADLIGRLTEGYLRKLVEGSALSEELKYFTACLALTRGMEESKFIEFCREEQERKGWGKNDPADIIEPLKHFMSTKATEGDSIYLGHPLPSILAENIFLYVLKEDNNGETAWRCYQAFGNAVISSIISCIQNYAPNNKDTEYLLLAWMERIYDGIRNDINVLEAFTDLIPLESLALQSFSVKLMAELVELKKKISPDELDTIAEYVNSYAVHLSKFGRREEALKYGQEAVDIQRGLVERNRGVYLPDFALSIGNLSTFLSDSGQREEALQYAQETVIIFQELVELNRDAHLPDLAGAINNLANRLSENGQREEALTYAQEAVDIRRELVELNRDAYLPGLAMSINNLATYLSDSGQHEEALQYAQETVIIFQELVEFNRDAYLPYLAVSINNHAIRLSDNEQRNEALKYAQDAVDIYQELVDFNRDAYLPNLAGSINNLAKLLSDNDLHEEALQYAQETVDIYQELVTLNRDAYLPYFAVSISNLANRLSKNGQRAKALTYAQVAVDIRRELTEHNRDAHLADLAGSISNLAVFLSERGWREEALKYGQEAVDIRRGLVEHNSNAYLPDLAKSIHNLAELLSDNGQCEESLKYAHEAVNIFQELVTLNRNAYLPNLAKSISNLAIILGDNGRHEEALKYAQEAVDIYRGLVELNRDSHLPGLAMSINNLATYLSDSGQREEALKYEQESIDIHRELVNLDRGAHLPNLALSLYNYSLYLQDVKDNNGALEKAKEAFELYKDLLQKHGSVFFDWAQKSARNYIDCLSEAGRGEEAAKLSGDIGKLLEVK